MGRFLCSVETIEQNIGSYVARRVYDNNGRLLLNLNLKVGKRVKESLEKHEIQFIWLSDEKVKDIKGSSDANLQSLKSKRKVLQDTFKDIRKEVLTCHNKSNTAISLSKNTLKKIEDSIDSMLDRIIENPFVAATLEPLYDDADYLIRHSINVTYFGLCLMANYQGINDILKDPEKGISRFESVNKINYNSYSMSNFGMTCFLHDIGKLPILDLVGESVSYDQSSEKDKEAWEQIRQHTIYGHDMLFGKNIDSHALLGVKYHHENWDGSGYPYGISGYKIHPFSRILRVIDSFDAAISKGPGRNDKDFRTILGELLALSGKYYDPEIVRYFVDMLLGGKSGLVSKGFVV